MSPWPASRSGYATDGPRGERTTARPRAPSATGRFARKVDAERFLASVENSKVTGTYVDPALAKVTVGEWAERWLAGQAHLKPTTRARYAGIVRTHIHPQWDRVRLANVSHGDVQAWVTELARGPLPRHRPEDAPRAVPGPRHGRQGRPAGAQRRCGVNLPRVAQARASLPHPRTGRGPRHCDRLPADASKHSSLDTRTNETYRLVVLFLAYTGVRFGEMAALRVGRLDLRRAARVIAESVTPVQGQGMVWGTPKTHQRREVPIPRFLADRAGRPRRGQGRPDDLVFTGVRSGRPLRVGTFRAATSTPPPRRSAFPTCTRTSCGTPPPASPSPAAPTSRSSSRCSATPRRR